MTSTPYFKGFLTDYAKLKRLTDGKPKNVRSLYKNLELQNVCRKLKTRSDILSYIRPINVIHIVPNEFPAALKDYNERYKNKINQEPRIIKINKAEKGSEQSGADIGNKHDYLFDSYYRKPEEVFSAINDFLLANGLSLKAKLWDPEWVGSILVSPDEGKGDPISRNGAKAYKYVCDVLLRDDLDKIFKRLKNLGHIYVPEIIAKKYGQGFSKLLTDACRAYILGMPLSTISISRAVVEMLCPANDRDNKKTLVERSKEIEGLDSKDQKKISKIIKSANDILHSSSASEAKSYTEKALEKDALKYLGYLKEIIQKVAEAAEARKRR